MTHRWLVLACVLMVASGAWAGDDKQDQEKMQGSWQAEKMMAGGADLPPELVKEFKVIIKGDKMNAGDAKDKDATFKLDSSKKPKTIDFTDSEGKKLVGIYELEGDSLKFCIGEKERPKEFKSEAGSDAIVIVLKRTK
jgi:uncharacterized protein (TIGR03067 family)